MSMATTMEPVAKEVEVPGRMPGQTKLNCYAIPLDLKVHGEVLAQKLEEAKKMPEIKGREANFSAPKGIPHCTFAFVETEPLFHLCHAFVQKLNINQTQDIKLGKLICFPVYDDMTKQKDTLAVVVQVISDKITQGHFEFMKQHKLQPKYRIDPKDPESPEDYNPHVTLGFFPKEATLQMTAIEFEEWTKVNRCDTCLKFKKELKARVAGVVHIYPSECKCSPIEFESDRDPEPEDFVPDT
jgi:hypothetical protein